MGMLKFSPPQVSLKNLNLRSYYTTPAKYIIIPIFTLFYEVAAAVEISDKKNTGSMGIHLGTLAAICKKMAEAV